MKVSKTISHRINMGNYESTTVGASVELDSDDFNSVEDALDEIDAVLTSAIAPEILELRKLADNKSYILEYRRSK